MHRYYAECKKRASLVPAAAVIPALRAYIKVVAFKTPVVEIAWWGEGEPRGAGGEKEEGCNMHVCTERASSEGRRGGRESVCSFTRAFNFSTKPLSLRILGLTARCVRVWSASFLLLFYCPPSRSTPSPPLSFVTIKKLECL